MDKKKKIIVTIVGGCCLVLLAVLFKVFLFPSDGGYGQKNRLAIGTPKVNQRKINRKSKLEHYAGEAIDRIQESTEDGSARITQNGQTAAEKFEISDRTESNELLDPIETIKKQQRTTGQGSVPKGSQRLQNQIATPSSPDDSVNDDLQQLMALQEQLLNQNLNENGAFEAGNADVEDVQKLLQSYQAYAQQTYPGTTVQVQNANGEYDPEKLVEIGEEIASKMSDAVEEFTAPKNYFHGATSGNSQKNVLGLIPAETVDQGILVNGSTVAIRTKKEVRLSTPPVLIPKGAIVYGKVSFGPNRLLIDITSYKEKNTLYQLDFSLFDFDGIEGVHLDNRTWPKIPAKVAKDVYDYSYQRGTQSSAFGNDQNGVNLDEAKNVALLSAIKEIGEEVFEKRKVFMPKKYHLWFNINTK